MGNIQQSLSFSQALRLECFKLTNDIKRAARAYDYILNGEVSPEDEDIKKDPYDAKLADENLSLRARNICEFSLEVETVGELAETRYNELTQIRGLGAKTYNELNELIREYGLSWGTKRQQ